MKTIKPISIIALVAFAVQLHAQKIWDERRGTIRAQGNLAPGYLFAQKQVTAYYNGDVSLFLDDRFAYTGALWLSFSTTHKNDPGIKVNHAIFSGGEYHFLKPSHWDPYVCLEPGVALVRAAYRNDEGTVIKAPYTVAPLISAGVGCNYYVGWLFHFFVRVQGVAGQVFSNMPTSQRLDEMKFMFGLGYNFRMWKPKKHDKWG